jgi:spermidine synthase
MSPEVSSHTDDALQRGHFVRALIGVGAIAGAILMIELALTRIFSVTMYYHFAFLAISIALFGLSASGVYVYVMRRTFDTRSTASLLTVHSLLFAAATVLALAALVRIRVGLNYSHENLVKMIAIYTLAALPFFSGGAVISLAITRFRKRVNVVYGADLIGAAAGCLLLLPLLNRFGAPGVVLLAAVLGGAAALLFSPARTFARTAALAALAVGIPGGLQLMGSAPFDVSNTKGHDEDTVLFAKWNSFSRVAVYDRSHGDWSLSSLYKGEKPETRFMDIDSAASTPIVRFDGDLSKVEYLKYELTGLAFHLVKRSPGFSTLVIGPGGGRDLLTALVFGAGRVDGVEVNPIIANDIMLGQFRDFSGSIYQNPKVNVVVDDGRSYIRRSNERYDVIQASLVDTWAATAAGAYTLTENTLYTKEAFEDYYDHLTARGVLTITRWVFDGLRLVSLAQEACASRGCSAKDHMAIVQQDRVATFLLKKTAFTEKDVEQLRATSNGLGFTVLYAPGQTDAGNDYAKLVLAPDRQAFYDGYHHDVSPTTDTRPFFFHTTKIKDQFQTAFGRSMLFGNGLSALMTLMAISVTFVTLFVVGPLVLSGSELRGSHWPRWLGYFGMLGAGFMLIEVALLQRFVLLLGHPVYSLTVTLFSVLLGTGVGSLISRRISQASLRRIIQLILLAIAGVAILGIVALPPIINAAISASHAQRIALTVLLIAPAGVLMGMPLPAGIRLMTANDSALVPWAWGMNGALSVIGATLAVFIAMNWGFSVTLMTGAAIYLTAAVLLHGSADT